MTLSVAWHRPRPGLGIVRRGARPVTRIQLYGQRCSGTNAVMRVLELNLDGVRMTCDFGFKHWFVPPQTLFAPDTLVVVVARDAFDWVRSLHRKPWHAHPDLKAKPFAEFIRSEWHSCWDEHCEHVEEGHPMLGAEMLHERDPDTGARFANCLAKRTAKLRHWAALPARAHNVALIGYDAFVADPAAVVAELGAAIGTAPRATFAPVASYKGQGHYRYVAEPYAALSADDVAHIERWLDPDVEAAFDLTARYAAA